MIDMIEPTDAIERQLAIRICRANAFLNPDDGSPETDRSRSRRVLKEGMAELPYNKWIWMWNYGRAEWDPDCSPPQHDGEPK